MAVCAVMRVHVLLGYPRVCYIGVPDAALLRVGWFVYVFTQCDKGGKCCVNVLNVCGWLFDRYVCTFMGFYSFFL